MMDETFQMRLRWLREHKRPVKSMIATSELMGFGKDTLGKYERGEATPVLDAAVVIADFYDVSLDYLAGRTNDKNFQNSPHMGNWKPKV